MDQKLGLKGKMGVALGAVGAGIGTIAGAGVGAVIGGTGGFVVGQMAEIPARKKQNKVNKNIEVTLIKK